MRRLLPLILLALLITACQGEPESESPVPTLLEIPSETPTETQTDTPAVTPTATDTHTPTATDTPVDTDTPSPTATASNTPTVTPTGTITPDLTRAAVGTGTAAVEEAPVFATLTPLPAGVEVRGRATSTGTPEIIAGIEITEAQYQEEIDLAIESIDGIQRATVDFTPEGIFFTLNALGDDGAFTTVEVQIIIVLAEQEGDTFFAAQGALLLNDDAPEPSEEFLTLVTNEFFLAAIDALDGIIGQRLGDTHDLEDLIIDNEKIAIALYIPDPGE